MTATNGKPRRRGQVTDRDLLLPLLPMIAQGMTNRQIGNQLYLSEDTVKTRVRALLRNLGVSTRGHAVAVAYDRGLLKPRRDVTPDRHASWCALLRRPHCDCQPGGINRDTAMVTTTASEEFL